MHDKNEWRPYAKWWVWITWPVVIPFLCLLDVLDYFDFFKYEHCPECEQYAQGQGEKRIGGNPDYSKCLCCFHIQAWDTLHDTMPYPQKFSSII